MFISDINILLFIKVARFFKKIWQPGPNFKGGTMVEIKWEFEKIPGVEIDPDDLLGSIKIVGDRGMIEDHCTYLDVWFDGLILGCNNIKVKKFTEYDLMSEPNKLIFEPNKGGLIITYGKSRITINDIADYCSALLKAVNLFWEEIHDVIKPSQEVLFREIRLFLKEAD